jgi:Arc/MetJ family transcription regulator
MSRTNIDLDNKLVKEGFSLTKLHTKRELVNFALEELVKKLKRRKILGLEGKVKWEGNLEKSRLSRV